MEEILQELKKQTAILEQLQASMDYQMRRMATRLEEIKI